MYGLAVLDHLTMSELIDGDFPVLDIISPCMDGMVGGYPLPSCNWGSSGTFFFLHGFWSSKLIPNSYVSGTKWGSSFLCMGWGGISSTHGINEVVKMHKTLINQNPKFVINFKVQILHPI